MERKRKILIVDDEKMSRLASFPELNPNPVMEVDLSGCINYINPAGRCLFPDLKTEGAKHPWINGLESVFDSFEKGETKVFSREVTIGEFCYQQEMYYVEQYRSVRMFGTDITEHKKTEEALLASRDYLDKIINSIGEPIFVLDRQHRLVLVNDAGCKHSGRTREENIGKNTYEIFPKEQADFFHKKDDEVFETGKENVNEECFTDARGNKSTIITKRTLYTDKEGKQFLVGIVQDITEQKLVEEALRESEEKYRGIVDNIGIGIALISPKMEILAMNMQMKKWFPDVDLSSKPICHRVFNDPPGEEICSYCPTNKSLQDGHVYEAITQTSAGDSIKNYRIISSPIKDKKGKIIMAIEMVEDITDRVEAEKALQKYSANLEEMVEKRTEELRNTQEKLIRQEKLAVLGQIAGGVGHELRNPLGVISNAVYFLKMTLPEANDITREYLDIMSEEIRRSEKIVSDLLDFSRIKPIDREEVTISSLIGEVLKRMHPPEKVNIINRLTPDIPSVFVDPQKTEQVLLNLIVNAYQSMPEGGDLTISAGMENKYVRLSITDTGCGISAENLKKIFEPLFTTRARGIGLGLAVSKNLVEVNGGKIEAESAEGKGSTFTVTLPVKE